MIPERYQTACGNGQNQDAGDGDGNGGSRSGIEEMDAGDKKKNGYPVRSQPEQADKKTRNSGSSVAEKIVNLGVDAWMMEKSIFRIKGKQAEQGKNHQKKKYYTDKFFAHGVLKNKPDE